MRFDLHIHTTLSQCSQLDLEEILTAAGSKGLDGVCITDHDTMSVRHRIEEGIQSNGLCVIFGMEYSTTEGDFLLFGPFEDMPTALPAPQLLDRVERAGGVAVAAHPFRARRPTQEYLVSQGLCHIVEGVNGRNQGSENASTSDWKDRYGVALVGGSDAHTLAELGQVTTRFTSPIRSRSNLIVALKTGAFTLQHME